MDNEIVVKAISDAQRQVKLWGETVDKRLLTKMVKTGLECFDGSTENANGTAFETGYKDGLGILKETRPTALEEDRQVVQIGIVS